MNEFLYKGLYESSIFRGRVRAYQMRKLAA
jgi:hypothetical protein